MQELDFSKVKFPFTLTPEYLLSKIDICAIMLYYIGHFKIGRAFNSPFRKDSLASASVFISRTGKLLYKDFKTGEVLNCWQIVQKKYQCNFHQALKIVSEDFGLTSKESKITKEFEKELLNLDKSIKKDTLIQFSSESWTKKNLKYWADYEIPQNILEKNLVYPVKELFINHLKIPKISTPRYAYIVNYLENGKHKRGVKIYAPLSKKFKWSSSVPLSIVGDLDTLEESGDICIVSKSKKDSMVLQRWFKNIIWSQNEGTGSFPDNIREDLQKRFKQVILIWGSDPQGVEMCTKYNQYGCEYFNTPKSDYDAFSIEDPADYIKMWGFKSFENLLQQKNLI